MSVIMSGNMESRKVLILGSKGMLGQELERAYRSDEAYMVFAWDREDIDVTDFRTVERMIREQSPALIINAIAYNAVDLCEEDDEEYRQAFRLNAEVPEFLARLAREIGASFVHYSTDYVFDGENEHGYAEDALPSPISRYGMSKWEGEKRVQSIGGAYYLIRLSKLFGKPAISGYGKKSFFEKMLEAAKGKERVDVVDGERSRFTYAPDLALATKVLEQNAAPFGIYHLVNEDSATWYEAAKTLFRIARMPIEVNPVLPETLSRPAKRPRSSILLNTQFIPFRSYAEALGEFLQQ